ncbi:glycosyltransferase family 4 protein [Candidatus Fermentibacteria bacterium]|nr:glycosyltransferase family 4 protein [Candidatus Fermentibacteria bacterium]
MYRVLGIAPTPFFSDRGCHVRILEEANALQELGHQVTICSYHLGRTPPGLIVHRIPRLPWYSKLDAGPSWHKYYIDILLTVRSLLTGLRDKPDIVHAHLHEGVFIGYFVSRILDVPLVFDLQGSLIGEMLAHEFISDRGISFRLNRFLEALTTQMADVILASSVGAASYLREDRALQAKKVHVVPEGIDVAAYEDCQDRDSVRQTLGIDNNAPVCVYLGLLYPYQGIDSLIRAARSAFDQCPDLHFLIIGFPNEAHYERMAADTGFGDRFHFVGRVRYEDLPSYLVAGDLAVTPKDSRTEANSKVYNFMAAGLPVVAYDTPTNRSILQDLGTYASRGDEDGLARAVGELATDRDRRHVVGLAARERAREFSWLNVGKKIVTVYDEVLRARE